MATLYLHIGTPKTGTTSIQRFCLRNRRALERRGYGFPDSPFFYPTIARERNGHFLVADPRKPDGSFPDAEGERNWRRGMERLAAQFRRTPNVILSDEGIWNSPEAPGMWPNLRAEARHLGFDVRVIAYLRRQDQFLSSAWAQRVKFPPGPMGAVKWEEALRRADEWIRLDYHQVLEEIAAHFGRENIVVRIYDRERFPEGNVVPDFLRALGVPELDDASVSVERNASICGDYLEIIRILNSIPGISDASLRRASRIALACCAAGAGEQRPAMFSPEERADFLRGFEESNRRLARDYFGDENLPLFPQPTDAISKWEGIDAPGMRESVIRFFAAAAFATQKEKLSRRVRLGLRRGRIAAWEWKQRICARLER